MSSACTLTHNNFLKRLAEHKQKRTNITMGKEEIPVHNGNNDDNYTSPLFRNVLDELVDAGVSEDQMVDEINTMLFGVSFNVAAAV